MRGTLFERLRAAAVTDPNIVLITGDLGFGAVENFADSHPERFLNAGVAEQNMTSMAAGMALAGAKVFTYSIANFPTLRCLEQIRNDIAYHHADVTVVAVGGGLAYGALGMSHHATEDLAIMRAIPGLAVAAPGDPAEATSAIDELLANGGPAYLRLGRAGERVIHCDPVTIERGDSTEVRAGADVAIFTTGAILDVAVDAAELLEHSGVQAHIRSFPWLDPLDVEAIKQAAYRWSAIVTLEEHSIVGGLGSAVAEVLIETHSSARLARIALPATFSSVVGDQNYLRSIHGLDAAGVSIRVLKHMEEAYGLARQFR